MAARTATSLDEIRVQSPAYQAALDAVESAGRDIDWARREIRRQRDLIEQLDSGLRQLVAGLPAMSERIDTADEIVDRAREDLADLAVLQYVIKGTDLDLMAITTGDGTEADTAQRVLVMDTAMAGHRASLDVAARRRDEAVAAVATATLGVDELSARLAAAEAALDEAQYVLAETSSRLPHLEARVATERRRTRVVGSDISYVALEAYLLASRALNASRPCGLDWTILAGIGRVESRHGTYGGTTLGDDGTVERPIIGIALDGNRETAVILDSDGGRLDGDTIYDRAVGPMQFIPTTWSAFAIDGNNDGLADPQNVYDASLAAAAYLCRAGDLSDDATLRHAIRTYNNSEVYVAAVLKNAAAYGELGIAG